MAVDVRILAAVLIVFTTDTYAQDRCAYMTSIPRDPKPPNLPPLNFEGQTWSQRALLPAEERDDVCMEGNAQLIYMDEEIQDEVAIAKLNYEGNQTPYVVSPLAFGTYNMLRPVIRRIPENGGDWHLVITQRQDYETPGMQQYMFEVRVDGETQSALVVLFIVNIDDNDPIIEMVEPCEIHELGEPGDSACKYVVRDADGEISTRFMTFTIDSDRGDNEVFELVPENVPGQWFWMYMVLVTKKSLDFAENPLHIFRVTAWDSYPNTHEVTMMVEVQNVEHRNPRWVEIFAMQQFDEKQAQTFRVRAIDSDTGIDKPIYYRLETAPEDKDFFSIETIGDGHDGALFHVTAINRDDIKREVFHMTIIAYKYGDNDEEGSPSFETPSNIVIIINDINDQLPQPFKQDGIYSVTIPEETAMTLNLENFGFHDRDLGPHAQYSVRLESVSPPGAHEAFYIAPEVGYQEQTFIVGTQNHHMLDFEVPAFQKIQIRAIATDLNDTRWVGIATIDINLENWNDELPIFAHSVQTVSFLETVEAGHFVGTVLAEDLDVDDRVEHTLMGNAVDYLRIEKETGRIYVTVNDAFNYHRQNELFVQVRADDTLGEPYNTATSQLVIQLEDVNNTPPTLRLPRGSPHVEENVPDGYVITQELTATDPDTTAELRFEIHWESSYATKQGREAPAVEFHKCVEIETLYPTINSRGHAIGRVVVREIRPGVTIDYEEFEVLYLTVRVRDLNTVIGDEYDESTFTITIIDMNDNAPLWGEGQLAQEFRVREVSASGVVIGSVLATDIDGPLYNQVRYTIVPRDDTPNDLVAIDFITGQITVKKNQAIDADEPKRYHLYYTIIASDRCSLEDLSQCPADPTVNDTPGDIAIQIIDTNNKVPVLETSQFPSIVYIYENATNGDEVVKIVASDLDRDYPNNAVSYQINYAVNPRLRDFFAVELNTGRVYVEYIPGGDVLDRDGDEPQHRIFFNVIDNFLGEGDGNRNQIDSDAEVLVVLLDVNDNAPELPEPHELSWTVSENLSKGSRLDPDIFAPDRDEPGTDNSRVAYEILGLTSDRNIGIIPDLFIMITVETERGIDQTGELETAMDLRGYWGTYEIHIQAYDHGHPQLESDEKYELVIRPYNFHEPVFVSPIPGSVIRLARDRAVVNGLLTKVNGDVLDSIIATDEDGLHAGVVTFSIVGDDEAAQYFDVWNHGDNSGTLTLKQALPDGFQKFQVTIRGTDGGDEPGPKSTDNTLTVVFIAQGDPVFPTNSHAVAFIEKSAGMSENFNLLEATDPKNTLCEDDCYTIYYSIISGNEGGQFRVDPEKNVLSLAAELDRSTQKQHTLVVAASNAPGATSAQPSSTLTVTVTVREADPRPVFERALYTAGISTVDTINRVLLTVEATQSENVPIEYSIDMKSMVVDSSLTAVQSNAFVLHPDTGVLTLNIQPTASMHGMFEFDVVATDLNGATGRSAVKVYLISSLNRVYFLFVNTLEQVEPQRNFIAETFSAGFDMTCNIDQTLPASNENGEARNDITEVRAHFIRDDLPVPAEEIEELRSNTALLQSIQQTLLLEQLSLQDLVTGGAPVLPGGDYAMAVYILAAIAALLAVICIALTITFFIRNRVLNRRIEALTTTRYGSVDSGLNNVGVAAPGTNKHAAEGSNPIWNETLKAPDFDALSEASSNDSDLIGIEDLPQFRNDYFPPENDSSLRNLDAILPKDTIASHNNNFGFNSTPFSPEFANSQFRR